MPFGREFLDRQPPQGSSAADQRMGLQGDRGGLYATTSVTELHRLAPFVAVQDRRGCTELAEAAGLNNLEVGNLFRWQLRDKHAITADAIHRFERLIRDPYAPERHADWPVAAFSVSKTMSEDRIRRNVR